MDVGIEQERRVEAERQFSRALGRGRLAPLAALLHGGGPGLPALEEVRRVLRPTAESYAGMRTVPVERIVGSEGRADDFDRAFRPRRRHLARRWMSVLLAHLGAVELPAVKLYEIGGVYFVRDGNHRVSVARHRGVRYLDAEVTSLATDVPLDPRMSVDDVRRAVLEREQALFAEAMSRFPVVAGSELVFTEPGGYDEVLAHVAAHRETLRRAGIAADPAAAARSWYEEVYLPLARLVRDAGILGRLPGRTAADVYLWMVAHWDDVAGAVTEDGRAAARRSFRRRLGRRRSGGRTA
jgi:hypothetical protein